MSTRSGIWQKTPDNNWRGVFCAHDSGPDMHVGNLLRDCYNTDEKVSALMDWAFSNQKTINTLHETPEATRWYDSDGFGLWLGGDDTSTRADKTREADSFDYLWEYDGEWKCYSRHGEITYPR